MIIGCTSIAILAKRIIEGFQSATPIMNTVEPKSLKMVLMIPAESMRSQTSASERVRHTFECWGYINKEADPEEKNRYQEMRAEGTERCIRN